MGRSLLRLPEVMRRTGESRSTIYRGMEKRRQGQTGPDTFPLSIPIGPKMVGWIDTEIDDYVEAKIAAARQPDTPRRPPVARPKERNTPAAPVTE
jgi:prophage regulatory protein